MTMDILCRIIEENDIPRDVHFMSDSGWECDPTEMDGVYYHKENNTIVFTQGGCSDREYEKSDEWEILYMPGLVKIEELEVYPVSSSMCFGVTEAFKKALRAAGDFESYYGIRETEDAYKEIDLNRPMFYCIKIKGSFIGYIGFSGDDNVLESEIYIFDQYRHKGYGTRVLKRFIDIAFGVGLVKSWREENQENTLPRYVWKRKIIFPTKLVSTVRVENTYSRKMMKACGFDENEDVAREFIAYIREDDDFDAGFIEVREYYLTKEQYCERSGLLRCQ